jgi:hypothetical protein
MDTSQGLSAAAIGKMQWSRAGNILHNSAMFTMLHILTTPVRSIRKQANKKAAND